VGKVLVVEDHALVREGLVMTLQRLRRGTEVLQAADAEAALEAMSRHEQELDAALLDLMLPGMNGFSLLGVMRKRFPRVPVIVVSALDDVPAVERAAQLGAAAFVPKSLGSEDLLAVVRGVLEGRSSFPAQPEPGHGHTRSARSRDRVATRFRLSVAQARVLDLLLAGKTNREIGGLLGVTEGTVKIHLSAIYRALNVSNRAQALVVVSRSGASL
jgi:DNA-binding NarL/FixJ family response regulator